MFGQRLRELRKEKKLSMKEFGKIFNLAESTISGYESGARKPDINTVDKFVDYFDVSYDYIMGKTDVRKYKDTDDHSFDSMREINKLLIKYGIEDSGFFDIEKWKAFGPEEIRYLEQHLEFMYQQAKKKK